VSRIALCPCATFQPNPFSSFREDAKHKGYTMQSLRVILAINCAAGKRYTHCSINV